MKKLWFSALAILLVLVLALASCDYGDFHVNNSQNAGEQGQDDTSAEDSIFSENISEIGETISDEHYISEDNESEEESSREEENLAAGKSYTFTGIIYNYTNEPQYADNDNWKLTDGVTGSVGDIGHKSDVWIGLNWKGEGAFCERITWSDDTIAKNSITVDLESSAGVYLFTLYAEEAGSGINKPKSVEVLISDDNSSFTSIGFTEAVMVVDAEKEENPSYGIYANTLALSEAVTARYVKFEITHGGAWTFVSEVEIYG